MSPVLKKRRTSIHSHKTKMKLSEISLNTGVIETSTAQNLTRIGLTCRHMSPNKRLSESSKRCTLTFLKIGSNSHRNGSTLWVRMDWRGGLEWKAVHISTTFNCCMRPSTWTLPCWMCVRSRSSLTWWWGTHNNKYTVLYELQTLWGSWTNILPRWSPVKMRELNYISSVVKLC